MAQISVTAPADKTEAGDDGRTTALTFSVTFDETPLDSTTVTYTVTINGVEAAPQELVLGTADGEITVEVPNDAADNGNDTVTVALTGVTAGNSTISTSSGSATATVVDDDTPSAVGTVLYRVNAGGAEVAATDGGPNWGADTGTFGTANNSPYLFTAPTVGTTFNNTGSSVTTTSGFVPDSTPLSVFDTERGDRGDTSPTLAYQFDVGTDYGLSAGDQVEVRLYFAEIFSGIEDPGNDADGDGTGSGNRVFDVAVDGVVPTAFNDIDAFDVAGLDTGFMRSYVATVDAEGLLDIEFLNGVENPAIKAIEIIARSPDNPIPPAKISIAAPDPATVKEAGDTDFTTLEFAVSFDKDPGEPITVEYSVAINGTVTSDLTLGLDPTGGVISVQVPNDDQDNGAESVTVTLTGVTVGGTAAVLGTAVSAISTVTEDDAVPLPPGTVVLAINSGGGVVDGAAYGLGDVDFLADTQSAPSAFVDFSDSTSGNRGNDGGAGQTFTGVGLPDDVFTSERWGNNWSYNVTQENGDSLPDGTYIVDLYFAETFVGVANTSGVNTRIFDVDIEGVKVLDNYDLFDDADGVNDDVGAPLVKIVKTYEANVADGVLTVNFNSTSDEGGLDNAKLSALVVRTPEAPGLAEISIADPVPAALEEAGDSGVTTLEFAVSFDKAPAEAVTVEYSVSIGDTVTNGLTQALGPTAGVISVDVPNDDLDNGTETVVVTLTGVAVGDTAAALGTAVSASGTITEDDVQLLVGFGPDNDLDSDGIANKDDDNVDGDAFDNNAETFSYDGTNEGTALTAGETILLGFETDGTPFENGLTGALDSPAAATTEIDLNAATVSGGTLNILASGGDAFQGLNTQQNALVAGYSAEYGMRVETRFAAPDWDASTDGVQDPVNFQSAGVVIGLDQNNYIKAVFGRTAQEFEFGTEINGAANNTATDTIAGNDYSAIFEIVIAIETFIDNSSGTPVAKAQAFGTLIGSDDSPLAGSDAVMLGAAKTLTGPLADAVLNGTVLGAGVVQTANGTQPTFNVSYEYLEVTASSMPLNEAPTVAAPIVDQTPPEDALYSFDIPPGTFADDMGEGALTLTATLGDDSPLPGWLSFDGTTFTGTPLQADVDLGAITVKVTATDGSGETVTDEFILTPQNVNDAPTITGTLAPATTTRGLATSVDLSALTLDDPDGTTPTLVAQIQGGAALPAGITLVGTSLEVAAGTAAGAYVIDIFANDTQVNSATPVSLTLTVDPPLPGTIVGTSDSETLIGTVGDDTILGLEGDDFVFSGGGDDTLIDGAGSDFYDGGDDQDTLVLSAALADFFSFQNLDGTLALSRGSDRETVDATVESLQFTDGTVDFATAFANASATVNLTDLYGGSMSVALSSEYPGGFGGENLLDDDTGTIAHTRNGADEWIELDFGDDLEITSVVLTNRNLAGDRLDGALVSLRDKFGATVFTFDQIAGATNGEVFELVLPTATTARSLYIDGADAQYLQLAEIDLIGLQPADYIPPVNLTELYGGSMSTELSSEYPGGYGGANLLDDNTGSFAHTQNGADEWIELDFGDDLEITSVVLTNRNLAGDRLDGALVSLRDEFGATVFTFDQIAGATNGEVFKLVLPTATTARSLYIDGADAQYLQLAEIDLIGLEPADYNPAVNLTDLYGGLMSTELSSEYPGGYGGANLLDDNTGSFAHTQNGADEWIELDFGDDLEITSVVLTNRNLAGDRLDGALVSLRDEFGATVFTFDQIAGATNGEVFELVLPTATTARSLYIDGADAQYLQLAEIDLFGLDPLAIV